MEHMILTDNNKNYNKEKPVLIDFWAKWCGPCKQMGPILDQIQDDRFIIAKADIEEASELASEMNIMGVPTFVLIKDNNEILRIVGAITKDKLMEQLNRVL